MKIFGKLIGIFLLLAVFALAYSATKSLDTDPAPTNNEMPQPTEGFSQTKQTVGEAGAVHSLRILTTEDQGTFWRVKVETGINRPSVLENIETPLTTAELRQDTGCYIQLHLSDTTQTLDGEPVFLGKTGRVVFPNDEKLPLVHTNVLPEREEGQFIQLGLSNCSAQFKLGSDPKNPGHIWLDVLK